jgi:hypothetical protein
VEARSVGKTGIGIFTVDYVTDDRGITVTTCEWQKL